MIIDFNKFKEAKEGEEFDNVNEVVSKYIKDNRVLMVSMMKNENDSRKAVVMTMVLTAILNTYLHPDKLEELGGLIQDSVFTYLDYFNDLIDRTDKKYEEHNMKKVIELWGKK